ncbi:Protein HIR1 [Hirsutella minnesotensis 3608]|uniref:Protein HIR n=1 Tax=Hirsutella minnesotensis 3608 TaxID=1043627 RepID=A0A0F7ZNI0_9HYPO|nr:Protein HIR1 [Hirsutella minnesotensis 3608]
MEAHQTTRNVSRRTDILLVHPKSKSQTDATGNFEKKERHVRLGQRAARHRVDRRYESPSGGDISATEDWQIQIPRTAPSQRDSSVQSSQIGAHVAAAPSVEMHIIKPAWLSHSGEQKDFEVYSCHVSSDGKRLATAGGDGHVRIWSTDAIYNANDGSYSKPRQLCHMSHHLGTIHSVRFSPNGRYLASGADDKLICVYHLDKGPPAASFGTNEPPPVENWKTYKRLIGHENDVQDLAWSYDSSLLVSVGLDSKVVVWSGHTFEKLKAIPAHQSHVKGITFDPANKFFATASDDRTIKIFRFTAPAPNATQHDMINNFVLETTISSPFKSSPLTTYFRRCSWSPDGNHIAAANAVNGPVSSVAIIERTRWDSEINLIGHEAPTEVCMFSPRLFHTVKPESNGAVNGHGGSLVTVIASAGQDKTLSIWNTNTSRPVIILQDLTGKSISDLAWTPDGQTLFASSLDGGIVVVKFDEGELGWVAQTEENVKALQKYGASRKGMGIAEDVDGLMLETHSKAGESKAAESRMGALMGDFQSDTKESTPATNGTKSVAPSTKPASTTNDEPDAEKEKDKDKDKKTEETDKLAERVRELKSRVTVGKDGKKRVAPLLVSSSGTGQSSLPQTQLVGSTTTKSTQNDAPQTMLDLTKPFDGLPKGGIASMLLGNKRKSVMGDAEDEEEPTSKRAATGPTPVVADGPNGVEPVTLAPVQNGVVPTPEFLRPAVLNPAISFAQVRLAVPKVRAHILRPLERGVLQADSSLDDASKAPENIILEAKNDANPRDPSHVIVTKRGALIWQEFLPRAVLLVTANKNFWAVACEDGSLHVWSPAGRRLLNPMILESQPVILECRDRWLLCITAVGLAHVWDLKKQSSPHPPVSLGPILDIATTSLNQHTATSGLGVTSAHLNTTGHVVVTLTNGDGFFYAREMHIWQRLSESWWAVGSQYWNSNDSSISALQSTAVGPTDNKDKTPSGVTVSSGIIPFLERHTTNEFLLKGRAYALQRIIKTAIQRREAEDLESTVSIAHLENRIAGAMQLGAKDEFRLYLFMYAKRLGAEGAKTKVEELLNSLMGGILQETTSDGDEDRGWYGKGDEICGWDRKELLKGVVLILGKYRELQRLTSQYARVLDLSLEDGSVDVESMDVET